MESNGKASILIIDDEKSNLIVLNTILSVDYTVFIAKSGEEGLNQAVRNKPDLILLDIIMPSMNGFEVLKRLKETKAVRHIPVIIITGLDNEEDEEKGFYLGAVDYIRKPFKNAIVKARIKTHLQIVHQIHTIEQLGRVDPLTDISNRRGFDERMNAEWWRALREKESISFMMIDVDKFKDYNDTYGHPQGDTLLKTLGEILTAAARRPRDLAARLGGEEFGILLPDTKLDAVIRIAESIRLKVETAQVPTVDGKITQVTISIGVVSLVPSPDISLEEFIAKADANLYTAKARGRNRVYADN
jgi:diguanylate cyclase (GGDEF)-like protein